MNKKLVRCVGYYGGNFMSDLLECSKSENLWEEVYRSDVEKGVLDQVKSHLTNVDEAREYMKDVDSAGDLYDLGVQWDFVGIKLMELATGERYREFKELENFAFLLHETGEVMQAFALELNDDDVQMNAYVSAFVDLMVAGVDTVDQVLGREEWE